jgi:hypothetical protein
MSVAKYGRFRNLEKALRGRWRVVPASFYKQSDLTAAQQDDELSKNHLLSPAATISIPSVGVRNIKPLGRIQRTMKIRRTYYLSSLTYCVDDSEPKFVEFSDARLLIRDPQTFGQRVCTAAQALHPSWLAFFAPVCYYDPDMGYPEFLPSDPVEMRDTLPWRLKEIKYAWQREWRFIWLPDTELRGDLPPIELVIGSISDIAVLEHLTIRDVDAAPQR